MGSNTDFIQILDGMISNNNNNRVIDFYEVTNYDATTLNITVKKLYEKTAQQHIIINGIGLGNDKGIVTGYEVGDILVCADINGYVVILTSIYNQFYEDQDTFIIPEGKEIILKSSSGAKLKFTQGGGFSLFDKSDYGIQSDGSGNITIFGDLVINGSVSSLQDGSGATVVSINSKTSGDF